MKVPLQPLAQNENYGPLFINTGLLWAVVAYHFGLLGFPGGHVMGRVQLELTWVSSMEVEDVWFR